MIELLKSSWLLFLILNLAFVSKGQVISEKRFIFGNGDYATSGTLLLDSSFLISYSDSRFISNLGIGKGLLRLNRNLDTLNSFVLPEKGNINQLILLDSSKVLAVGTVANSNQIFKGRADCYDLNYTLQWILNLDSLKGTNIIQSACIDTNGFIYMTGYQDLDTVRGFNSRVFCLRMTSFGTIDWFKFYDWGSPLQASYSIAQMENGNFMVGGTTGALIVGMELDENGNRVAPLTTFFTPDSLYYNTNTIIQPLPNSRFFVRGIQQPGYVCLAITDRFGTALWREYGRGGVSIPMIHASDGSITIGRSDSGSTNYRFERIRNDGTLLWRLSYPNTINQLYRNFGAIIPSYEGWGLAYGRKVDYSIAKTSVFLAKIANVGYPAPPLSTPLSVQVQAVSAYPNPTVGAVVLGIPSLVAGQATSVLVDALDMRGVRHQLLATNDLGGYRLDLSSLPAGLYHLSLVVGGQRYVARVVRE
jgi:hypothetical protein